MMSPFPNFLPLVMGLRMPFVRAMLKGKKTVELRRRIPSDPMWLNCEYSDRPGVRPVFFVGAGEGKGCGGNPLPRVRVIADIINILFTNLSEYFIPGEALDDKASFLDPRTQKLHPSAISWLRAMQYQGDREGIFLLFLDNIREVEIPVRCCGITERTPQSFAWSKNDVPTTEKLAAAFWKERDERIANFWKEREIKITH